jgi:hypothetical protein
VKKEGIGLFEVSLYAPNPYKSSPVFASYSAYWNKEEDTIFLSSLGLISGVEVHDVKFRMSSLIAGSRNNFHRLMRDKQIEPFFRKEPGSYEDYLFYCSTSWTTQWLPQ